MTQQKHKSAPIRILRIITRLNIGGPSIQAIKLSRRLDSAGFHTTLVHGQLGPDEGDMQTLLSTEGLNTISMPTLRRKVDPLNDIRTFWQLLRLLRNLRPALVHTHMAKAGAIGRQAAIVYNTLWARNHPAKLVHTYHGHVLEGYFSAPKTALFLAAEKLLARRTDTLIAVSAQVRQELLKEYRIGREDRFQIVPLGLDLAALEAIDNTARRDARKQLGIPEEAKVIVWVGRLTPIKQPEVFLDAAKLIKLRHPQAIFLVVGDGELRSEVESKARALKMTNDIRFLGWRGDLPTIYAASNLSLLTSRNEGTPVAIIEAMASGLPSVSPNVGGVRDVITDPSVGTIVEEGSPESLAATACALLDSPDLCREIGESARSSAVGRFGFARLVSDITALYHGLLNLPPVSLGQAPRDSAPRLS